MIADQKTWTTFLNSIGISLVPIGCSSFSLESLDRKYVIAMGDFASPSYVGGWTSLQNLENDICKRYPLFVYFNESMQRQQTAVNPFLGCKSLEEMLVKLDLQRV